MRPEILCGLLAESDRLRTYAAVVLGAGTPADVAANTGLPLRTVMAAVRRLTDGGLLTDVDGRLSASEAPFKEAARAASPDPGATEPLDPDRHRAAVLRSFVVDGRLTQMPSAHAKRRVVLEHIVAVFEPGVKYPEKAVDAILRAWHPDYAATRRYLIDEGLMAREQGVYWRTGGYVDPT